MGKASQNDDWQATEWGEDGQEAMQERKEESKVLLSQCFGRTGNETRFSSGAARRLNNSG